jgi:Zn-dependent peptidase ImmA (M78 family)/transcriptional regulator with XRE-family HTH domain
MSEKIGQRIRIEREIKGISLDILAKDLEWDIRDLMAIEEGEREIEPWELNEISKYLQVDVDMLMGNAESLESPYVLWREKPLQNKKLLEARFLNECDNYLWIEQVVSSSQEHASLVFEELPKRKINLSKFHLSDAYQFAEDIRKSLVLGDFPATQLLAVLEDRYGVKFIVDNDEIQSSAACSRSEKGCFIFINGHHPEPRQYFSIAHELFHLITWDEEMLESVEANPNMHDKNEKLANAFAAGLLIPQEKVRIEIGRICPDRSITASDVIALAEQFQVSKDAMLYRIKNINLITSKEDNDIRSLLQGISIPKIYGSSPTMTQYLKSKFVRLVYLACEHVKISRSKAAKLLKVDLCDLSDLFNNYGFVEVNV